MSKYLIVEDDNNQALSLKTIIEDINNENKVYIANSCAQALELTSKYEFNVITIDINLPDGNGLDIVEILNNKPTKIKPWIIVVTVEGEYILKAYDELGVRKYLTKPYDKDVVKELLLGLQNYDIRRKESFFTLIGNKASLRLKMDNILYFEKSKRDTILTTSNGIQHNLGRKPIKEILDENKNTSLFRCYKSIIVNIKNVYKISKEDGMTYIYLINDQKLPISNAYINDFKQRSHLD